MQRLRSAASIAGVWLLASACGPGVATPMPEPPAAAFDLTGVGQGVTAAKQPSDPSILGIFAKADTVPGDSVVRITNLDTTDDVSAGNASPQGSFVVDLGVADGHELRFEWVKAGERSLPADAIVSRPDPAGQAFSVMASARFDCLKLTPGLVLDFGASAQATLTLENHCTDPLTLANPRARLNLADFALPATLPPSIAVGKSVSVSVDFTRGTAGLREDILFIDVTRAGTTIRYPITLRAP